MGAGQHSYLQVPRYRDIMQNPRRWERWHLQGSSSGSFTGVWGVSRQPNHQIDDGQGWSRYNHCPKRVKKQQKFGGWCHDEDFRHTLGRTCGMIWSRTSGTHLCNRLLEIPQHEIRIRQTPMVSSRRNYAAGLTPPLKALHGCTMLHRASHRKGKIVPKTSLNPGNQSTQEWEKKSIVWSRNNLSMLRSRFQMSHAYPRAPMRPKTWAIFRRHR